ncbi:MAG: transcription antitermination factor NusB [Saccharofermentanales bacterium]
MSRRESRELAFKLLYQMEIQKEDSDEQKIQFIEDRNVKANEMEYFDLLFLGVSESKSEIDKVYSQYLKNWNLDRIAKIDQTILRIATYEIMHVPMVPFNVSVSEAVFLAKKYSTDEARSFINGILSNLSYLKPHENLLEEEIEDSENHDEKPDKD